VEWEESGRKERRGSGLSFRRLLPAVFLGATMYGEPSLGDQPAPEGGAAPSPPAAAAPAPPAKPAEDDLSFLQFKLPSPINSLEKSLGYPIDGTFTNRYRARWTSSSSDQDLYQNLWLRAGDPEKNRVSGTFLGRLSEDIDGRSHGPGFSVFRDINDTYTSNVNGRFYEGYLDLRNMEWMERAHLETIRGGRQVFDESAETLVFDGGRIDSRPFRGLKDLRLTAYGGLPVHYFESSARGDAMVGAGAEASPWPLGRARIDWTYLQDRRDDLEVRNHLVSFALWQGFGERFSLHGRYNLLDGQSRDYLVRGTFQEPKWDFLFQASFHQSVATIRQLAIELDPFFSVVQELRPFWEVDLRASKGLGPHLVVDGGISLRQLDRSSDEGSFNHDFRRYYLTPATRDWPFRGTTISVTGEVWDSQDNQIFSVGGEVSQRFAKVIQVSAGSSYYLYRFDFFSDEERTHVRTFFGRLDYQLAKDLRLFGLYQYERDDLFTYHTVEVGLRYSF
jgi:hypothetical protein